METFILYYIAWHENEFSLVEMRELLIGELGEAGFVQVLAEFKTQRLAREAAGDLRTMYRILKDEETTRAAA